MTVYYISHSGVPGMRAGDRNGPPYPLSAAMRAKLAARAAESKDNLKEKTKREPSSVAKLTDRIKGKLLKAVSRENDRTDFSNLDSLKLRNNKYVKEAKAQLNDARVKLSDAENDLDKYVQDSFGKNQMKHAKKFYDANKEEVDKNWSKYVERSDFREDSYIDLSKNNKELAKIYFVMDDYGEAVYNDWAKSDKKLRNLENKIQDASEQYRKEAAILTSKMMKDIGNVPISNASYNKKEVDKMVSDYVKFFNSATGGVVPYPDWAILKDPKEVEEYFNNHKW